MSGQAKASSANAREVVRAAARAHAYDRYLTALLAPRPVRDDLVTIAAYLGETARIPLAVSEPMVGEIRLAWWRDATDPGQQDALTGNPIADDLIGVIRRHDLPRDLVALPLEGRAREMREDGMADEAAFAAYLAETEGTAFRLAARVLAGPLTPAAEHLCLLAGAAMGRVHLALALPLHVARGRLPLPLTRRGAGDPRALPPREAQSAARTLIADLAQEARDALREARAAAGGNDRIVPALLPLALIEPYLQALESPGHDPLSELADISPLARVWRLRRARQRGRF